MQLANDTFNWRRQSGRTGSYGTGPTYDHTTKSPLGMSFHNGNGARKCLVSEVTISIIRIVATCTAACT